MKQTLIFAFRLATSYGSLAAGVVLWTVLLSHLHSPDRPVADWTAPDGAVDRPLVVVDAGHGGHDRGAAANRLIEKEATLDIARRLQRQLESRGVSVRMTRAEDKFVSLDGRAEIANDSRAVAFISVHLNIASEGPADAHGIETYFCGSKSLSAVRLIRTSLDIKGSGGLSDLRGQKLAEVIQRIASARTQAADRGVKERKYTVIHATACPAVLVECGFMTHAAEAAKLRREEYRDKLADGLAEGVCAFLQAQTLKPRRGVLLEAPKSVPANGLAASD